MARSNRVAHIDSVASLSGYLASFGMLVRGNVIVVDPSNIYENALDAPVKTIQAAHDKAQAGDAIVLSPADYDEAVTITKSNLTFVGMGGRGAVAVAPSAANGIAWTIEGTAAARTSNVTLINVGGEGKGTGGGIHVKGNIRRMRFIGCKFEGGAFAVKLESTAAGSVGDTRIEDCEFAWATRGLDLVVSGAGDAVTQTYVYRSLFHNLDTDHVRAATVETHNIWLVDNVFSRDQAGADPTQYLELDVAGTDGYVAGNYFQTTVFSTALFALATNVMFTDNKSERENPSANVGGTNGRPD